MWETQKAPCDFGEKMIRHITHMTLLKENWTALMLEG